MIYLGVFGDNLGATTIYILSQFYDLWGKRWISIHPNCDKNEFREKLKEAKAGETDTFIVPLNQKTIKYCQDCGIRFEIFLYLSGEKRGSLSPKELKDCLAYRHIMVINSDDKRISPLTIGTGSTYITCGLNGKANVTISSVSNCMEFDRIQCCVQKTINTISGASFEPQEFAVNIRGKDKSVSSVLAAVTTMMAGDMEIAQTIGIMRKGTSKEKKIE